MENPINKSVVAAAFLLAAALFCGLWLHGREMADRSTNKTLTVTGSVKKTVSSDLAKWSASFTRRSDLSNLNQILGQLEKDRANIKKFVIDLGLEEKDITFLPVQTNSIYEQLPGYGYTQNVIGYNATQEIRVESNDIDKIEKLANETNKIVALGVVPDYQRTEYFYTQLDQLRPQLFADATKDAKQRAEAIAAGGGATVENLMSAHTGVIQVMQPNSTDVSDYGTYDLSTREKEISATVSVTFRLK